MRPENRLLDLMKGGGLPEGDPGTWKDHGASMREIRDRPFWNVDFAGRETHTEKDRHGKAQVHTHPEKGRPGPGGVGANFRAKQP